MNDGVHLAVLLEEAVAALAIKPAGIYVDATFGRGGHARAILAALSARGRLVGIDRDPAAQHAAEKLAHADTRFVFRRAWFSQLPDVLAELVLDKVDGVLLDLGISSPQIDGPERGFSFQHDGPLDMRMDPTQGESVADFLRRASVAELTEVIRDYGEERYAQSIAKAIVAARTRAPIVRTRQLAEVVGAAAGARTRGDWRQDPATRTFQALRIFANQELTEVRETLPRVVTALATGGRLAVISFHSLEDRIVKRFLTRAAQPYAGDSAVARLAIRASALPGTPLTRIGRARHPSPAEIARNPRSRSAILRVAERTEHPLPVHWPRGYLDDAV
ncbi:MAG: 16S rRNA (cytosine(1402)-N(4))-methyltransferase RsmH [Betaproteobacteria bacterium]|nr:16S rRNA (cytosine(1402)-N(4))-methyltransferase RsmH [Betaproteobacteria bacterium]MBA3775847.1 16S rRNA (cytosine(1402)-N(4))-methyltransferase RsmH [Betaproteobacteria bacterium]